VRIDAVLQDLQMQGGIQEGNGRVTFDTGEFLLWLACLNNWVIDQEACGFLREKF
jgi:hypothetical protein